ncbi:P-loop containing nucleoside triphosphate hydrolase protein [Periconia macrospinosa]|uniref:P-loop containing nucleoside triphosphate hydrolase protein n=1 Tax=Periconia macrospinosa TaxID=97972 RepID=A0A2V1DMC3_9PLEO|nr:P-loop containing nucleoside triphosphate hydrolase protein [Periconia macrospinosa]
MPPSACSPSMDDLFGPVVDTCVRSFDFTRLFEDSIFGIGFPALFLFAGSLRIFCLKSTPSALSPLDYRRGLRVVLSFKGALAFALLVVWNTTKTPHQTRAAVPSEIMEIIASMFLLFISHVEYAKSRRPPVFTSAYLMLNLAFTSVRVRTDFAISGNGIVAGLRSAQLAIVFLALALAIVKRRAPEDRTSPEQRSGLFGIAFYTWLLPFLIRGYRGGLHQTSHLDDIDTTFRRRDAQFNLPSGWGEYHDKSKNHLLIRAIASTLKWPLMIPMLSRLVMATFLYTQPLLLSRTVRYIEHEEKSRSTGYGLIGAYALVYIGLSISSGLYWRGVNRFITHIRGILIHSLYQKSATLPSWRIENMEAVSLMNSDVERIVVSIRMLHESWATILEAAVAIFLLSREVGVLALAPIAVGFGESCTPRRNNTSHPVFRMEALEQRIQGTIPVLDSIREIRMLAISPKIEMFVQNLRKSEIRMARWFRQVIITAFALAYGPMTLSPAIVFTAYAIKVDSEGSQFETARVFTALSLMNLLAVPLITFLQALPQLAGAVANFRRIEGFLTLQAHEDFRSVFENCNEEKESACQLIRLQKVSVGWSNDDKPSLHEINLSIERSSLTVVIGPSGSGKTTLLKTILGETKLFQGFVGVSVASIAFADQTSWFAHASIRENIVGLDNQSVDEDLYRRSLQACSVDENWVPLNQKISSSMPGLSGGQKQRIALARIAYAQQDLVILDDPFSAMDQLTEQRVFDGLCGPSGLLRVTGSTVVMATHSTYCIEKADTLAVLSLKGNLEYAGEAEVWLAGRDSLPETNIEVHSIALSNKSDKMAPSVECHVDKEGNTLAHSSSASTITMDFRKNSSHQGIYRYYFKALGGRNLAVFAAACISFTFCLRFPDLWLSWWATANSKKPGQDVGRYIGVYVALQLGTLLLVTLWAWSYLNWAVPQSGLYFHKQLIKTAMSESMTSLSTGGGTGVTVNRFSQDLLLTDSELPGAFVNTAAETASILAQLIIIAVSFYYFCATYPFIFVLLFALQHFYLRTSQPLRILDIEAKGPLCTHFIDMIQGLTTIRAFGWQDNLQQKLDHALQESQKAFYLMLSIQQWLNLVLDLIVAGFAVIVVGVTIPLKDSIEPAALGLILNNMVSLGDNLRNLFVFWTQLETSIGSVKRIKDFVENTDREDRRNGVQPPPETWPAKGLIRFEGVSVSYQKEIKRPALADVSFTVQPGQKVGICGRSGCGKSTLIATLFGLLELSEGRILIDDIDVANISLQTLRERLACVPQSSYMLPGSVRENLNSSPGVHGDDMVLWNVLQRVQLDDVIRENGGLDTDVADAHLSKGQVQLLCIARALFNTSRIVVMDEPSSAMDRKTDALIRDLIYTEFSNRTVLIVSHRMDWMKDVDLVIRLEDGRVAEIDAPAKMLGAFSASQPNK